MELLVNQINNVLIEWNPIGVPSEIAATEYKMYIPSIISCLRDNKELSKYLEQLLTKQMGLEYSQANQEQRQHLRNVADEIERIYRQK